MTSMKIRAYRPLNFNGEMFLKQSMFGCKLTEMFTNVAGYKMYELDIPLQSISPCSLKKTENPEVVNSTSNNLYVSKVNDKKPVMFNPFLPPCMYHSMIAKTILLFFQHRHMTSQ